MAVSGGFNPVLSLAPGDRHRPRLRRGRRPRFVPDGSGPPWLTHRRVAPRATSPPAIPLWVVPDGDDAEKFVEPQRDQTVADVAGAVGLGAAQRRAREAGHVHRDDDRPGPHERRRSPRSSTNALARVGPGRAGPLERAAALHAGPVPRPRRRRHRPPAARPGPHDADAPVARRGRRPDGDRRAVAPPVVLPARTGSRWPSRSRANAWPSAPPRGWSTPRRSARSRSVGADAGVFLDRHVHEPDVEPAGRARSATGSCSGSTGWWSTTASRCAWPRTATWSRPPPAAPPPCSTGSSSGSRRSGRTCASHCTSVTERWAVAGVGGPGRASRARCRRHRHRPGERRLPVHDAPRGDARRRPRARVPRLVHGRALLRGPRRRRATGCTCGRP